MKTKLFILSAIVLTAAWSCHREKDSITVNPTYDADANTVKAEFVLNLATPATGGGQTKTTAEFAQVGDNPTFLGMEAVHLLAYNLGERNFYYLPSERYTVTEGETQVEKIRKFPALRDFDLGSLFGPGDVDKDKASRSVQLALPLGTNAMVLYGKAKKDASSDLQGAVTTSGKVEDLSTIQFSLVPRLSSQDAFDGATFVFTRCLNYLMSTGMVDEVNFWTNATGKVDRSYAFWWPIDDNTPAFKVGTATGEYTKTVSQTDGSFTYTENVTEGTAKVLKNGSTSTDGNYVFHCGQLSWKQLGKMYDYMYDNNGSTNPTSIPTPNMALSPLGEVLGSAYSAITTIVQKGDYKELRSGSSGSILRMMDDLYTIVHKVATTSPTGWEEQVAKLLGEEIQRRIETIFYYSGGKLYFLPTFNDVEQENPDTGETETVKVADLTTVDVTTFLKMAELAGPPSNWEANLDKIKLIDENFFSVGGNKGFPVNLGLPFGAACLACTVVNDVDAAKKSVDTFDYVTDIPAYGMGNATFPIANYRYPPELMYYGNSPIYVSNEVISTYPGSVASWDNYSWEGNGWAQGEVTSTTRSVAMVNHINYGTALLKTTVNFKADLTELEDNNAYIHPGEENNVIKLNTKSNAGFVVTGIVVGGQPNTVCWDYTRSADDLNVVWKWDENAKLFTDDKGGAIKFDNNKFDKMLYDKVIRANDYVIGSNNSPIYTFAWDNYDATLAADKQSDVYIALEILNDTGKDFWGELNLVRDGGTFYLIGKLDMSKAKTSSYVDPTTLSHYNYPPYKTQDGSTVNAPRVFMQNYVTTANIILDRYALQHAYLTMPDLRSSQITMGLVIDMTWQTGLEYNVTIGETDISGN